MSVLSERVTDLAKFYDSHSARTAADQSILKGNNVAIDNQTLFFPQPQEDENGLTLRDWFAGAYAVADAMLEARSEGEG